jgi:hypothetical protein
MKYIVKLFKLKVKYKLIIILKMSDSKSCKRYNCYFSQHLSKMHPFQLKVSTILSSLVQGNNGECLHIDVIVTSSMQLFRHTIHTLPFYHYILFYGNIFS